MNVAFWSWFPGAGAVSSSMLAVALSTAIDHRMSCSVLQLHYDGNGLFKYILPSSDSDRIEFFENTGMDALVRMTRGGVANPDEIRNCSFSFVEKRLNIFTPTNISTEPIYLSGIEQCIQNLFVALNGTFKLNFIDVPAGVNNYSNKALALADVIVVCMPQCKWALDYYFSHFKFADKKVFFLFTNYDAQQSFNLFNLSLAYPKDIKFGNSGCIPHNSEFADEMNRSKVISFYLRNKACRQDDINFQFVENTRKSTSKLLKMCGYNKE